MDKVFTKEERQKIMEEVQNRSPEESTDSVMKKYGRTAQTYYNWLKQSKGIKTVRAKASNARQAGKPSASDRPWVVGVHMPSGKKVRVYTNNPTGAPIVMDWD